MPKDAGIEWIVPSEPEKSSTWALNTSDHRSGLCKIELTYSGRDQLSAAKITPEAIAKIWPEDNFTVKRKDTLFPDGSGVSLSISPKNNPDRVIQYTFDQQRGAVSFLNLDLRFDEADTYPAVFDPTEDNISACQKLSQFGELLNLPTIDHHIQLQMQDYVLQKLREDRASLPTQKIKRQIRASEGAVETARRHEKATAIYSNILPPLLREANPELADIDLDPDLCPSEIRAKIAAASRVNTIQEIASLLTDHPTIFQAEDALEWIRHYLQHATLAHNWMPNDDTMGLGGRPKHQDISKVFQIPPNLEKHTLSCVVASPNTQKFRMIGTGWDQARPTYTLDLDHYGGQTIVFNGDIDAEGGPMYGRSTDNPRQYYDNVFTLRDAALLQAIEDYLTDELLEEVGAESGQDRQGVAYQHYRTRTHYYEVIVFARVDFSVLTPIRVPDDLRV